MTVGEVYEMVGTPVGSTGVQFVMAVSLGQLIVIAITLVGFIAGVGKLYATVGQSKKAVSLMQEEMAAFRDDIKNIERRHDEALAACREEHREQMMQMRGSLDNLHQAMYSALRIDNRARSAKSIEDGKSGALPG